ncbi:MAG: hypothetical protein ACOC3C_04110 [Candidatus Thorarchaeota archaeon]
MSYRVQDRENVYLSVGEVTVFNVINNENERFQGRNWVSGYNASEQRCLEAWKKEVGLDES